MFWPAVLGGFALLSHWEVWVGIGVYLLVIVATWMLPALLFIGKGGEERSGSAMLGCFYLNIVRPLITGAALGVILWYLFPTLLGVPWPATADSTDIFFAMAIGAISLMGVLVLSFVPILGGIIAEAPGVSTYVQGIIIFWLAFAGTMSDHHMPDSLLPGFWHIVGFAVIAIVFTYILIAIVALLSSLPKVNGEAIGTLIGPVLMTFAGIFPLLMYAAEFAANLRAAGH